MACACKQKKAGQVTAMKQVVKRPTVSSHSIGVENTSKEIDAATATTVKRSVIKRIRFKRHT